MKLVIARRQRQRSIQYRGWSYRDIAAQLEIEVGTFRVHLHRARQQLLHLLPY